MCDGVADLHLLGVLYAADDIAHLSGVELLSRQHVHLQHSDFVGVVFHAGVEELDFVAFPDRAVLYFEICYDAAERIEN